MIFLKLAHQARVTVFFPFLVFLLMLLDIVGLNIFIVPIANAYTPPPSSLSPSPSPSPPSCSTSTFHSLICILKKNKCYSISSKSLIPPYLGYECGILDAFEPNQWSHKHLPAFMKTLNSQIKPLISTIATSSASTPKLDIVFQGSADALKIVKPRQWSAVSKTCNKTKKSGIITNDDLAYLRACTVRDAIPFPVPSYVHLISGSGTLCSKTSYLKTFCHVSEKTRVGSSYRSVKLIIVFKR